MAPGIYQIVESTPTSFMPFHRAMMYMTIIVIGRPPVPAETNEAVIFVTVAIMVSASIIPAFVAELARLYFESQGQETYSGSASQPHVIVCGDINASRLKALLGQFFHKSRDAELVLQCVADLVRQREEAQPGIEVRRQHAADHELVGGEVVEGQPGEWVHFAPPRREGRVQRGDFRAREVCQRGLEFGLERAQRGGLGALVFGVEGRVVEGEDLHRVRQGDGTRGGGARSRRNRRRCPAPSPR